MSLPPGTFHHAVRVRRLRIGDPLVLFAGDGSEATAKLVTVGRDHGEVAIENVAVVDRESTLDIALLQGISAGDRMDYTLQKAVELGIGSIVPVAMQRSMPLDNARSVKRIAHWQQVIISACEQSGRNRIPQLHAVTELGGALRQIRAGCRLLLAGGSATRLREVTKPSSPIAVLAGPEGGLTNDEERLAIDDGFVAISLGPRILRTETAAVAAIAAMQAWWGDG